MPKRTYGIAVKKRTLRVLKALIQLANFEATAISPSNISYRWLDRDTGQPRLIIQSTLTELWQVCCSIAHEAQADDLTQAEVREAFHALEKFLGILQDHRISAQGSPQWHFTLVLWSTQTDDNLAFADRLWCEKQAQKKAGLERGPRWSKTGALGPSPADFSQAASRLKCYGQWFVKTYGHIKILPNVTRRSIALDHIYVNVSVSRGEGITHLSSTAIEVFNDRFNSRSPLIDSSTLEDGIHVARQQSRLMVLGVPGSGKSTLLKKLGLEAIKTAEKTGDLCIPVLVELKLWSQGDTDLKTYMQQEIYRNPTETDGDDLTAHLNRGHLLILLDGLDEVPAEALGTCIDQLRAFIKTFDQNRFVISCRTSDYSYGFPQFVDVEVVGFSDAQIKNFIENWFVAGAKPKNNHYLSLWKSLNRSRNLPIKELARTPLLLFYLCLVYETGVSLPETRGQVYAKILDIFLTDWPRQKNAGGGSNKNQPRLTLYSERKLLAEMAYKSFSSNQLVFAKLYIQQAIDDFLTRESESRAIDPGALLQEIESRQGILVERFQGYFSFSHLTLQEYLTAQYVAENAAAEQVMCAHMGDRRWREVVLIAIEILGDRGIDLLEPMYRLACDRLAVHPQLTNLLQKVQQCALDLFGPTATLAHRASVAAAVSAIAAARASDFDMSIAVGPAIAAPLTRASDSAMAMAGGGAIAAAGVNSALALATARALAADEARAAEIDWVIHGASELIDQAREGKSPDNVDNAKVVALALEASQRQLTSLVATTPSSPPAALTQLTAALPTYVAALPNPDASAAWLPWALQLEQDWLSALGLDRATVTLTVAEATAWETYLYQCELISRSLDSALPQAACRGQDLRACLLSCD
ncbi:MAG: NACHT domain-containing protein [Nodosilinea sp.]